MKKIVLVMALVVCASLAQAAKVSWKFTSSNDLASYKVYAFTAALAEVTVDNIKSSGSSATLTAGRSSATATGAITGLSGSTGSDQDVYLYVLSTDETSYYMQKVSGSLESDTAASTYTASFSNTTLSPSNFTPVGNVPEPTSALLMLLGVAGLALKRKRV